MSETAGNKELAFVFVAEFHHHIFAESGRTFAQIDSHIKHLSFYNPHQFGLGKLALLKVDAANGAETGFRLVVLNKIIVNPLLFQLRLVPAFEKIATGVFKNLRFNDKNPVDCRFRNLHDSPRKHV